MAPRKLSDIIRSFVYKKNLIFIFLLSFVIAVFVFIVTYYIDQKDWLEKITLVSNEWERTIDHYYDVLDFFADRSKDFENPGTILQVLKLIREHFGDYIAYPIFATPDGTYYIYPLYTFPPDFDPRERPWYKVAVENPNSAVITPPLTHRILGVVTFAISRAIFDERGNLLGVLGIDIVPSKVMKDLLQPGMYVLSEDGTVLLQNGDIYVKLDPEDFESTDRGAKISMSGVAFFRKTGSTVFVIQVPLFVFLRNSLLHLGYVIGLAFIISFPIVRKVSKLIDRELRIPLEVFSKASKEYLRSRIFDLGDVSSNILEINQLIDEVSDMITIIESQREELEASYEELEASYSELQKMAQEIEEKSRAVEEAYEFFTYKLVDIVEGFDEPTGNHVRRVQELSKFFAEEMGLDEDLVHKIYLYAPLHDIGKIKVPKEILNKKGKLTAEEWEIMKKHTIWGGELLSGRKELEVARNIALYHHENYDGTGYPFGLKDDEIPIEAQIVKIVDVYDALRSEEPYKKALSHEEAVRVILEGDGRTSPSNFHPKLIEIFREKHEKIREIWEQTYSE
ncbi:MULTISPECIES: HD domain-containing phosphohydrolase [unclassified Thermotoga]|uniref:HD domain-containing phosphohydrolase n=1 Tax=unclassified Thermotoga TaxID=2631113 RepID=UPI000543540D|nr:MULTISPECIES: HD domain-containing phosphohydrolase [unclassified Thermotoga]KHC95078.1 metal dependent phosphohydrolase [Thermotoga sp. TBGT1765]KHC95475.1 metal dependent phosphohydrolase [Thermotoga sp. TBGT1766]